MAKPRSSRHRHGQRSISVSNEAFPKLVDGLPTTSNGRRRGVKERMDRAINAALDAEQADN